MKTFVTEISKLDDYKLAVVDKIVEKCSSIQVDSSDHGDNANKCSKIGMKMMWCMNKELFLACPDDKQDKSENCTKMREHMKKGPHKKEGEPGNDSETTEAQ